VLVLVGAVVVVLLAVLGGGVYLITRYWRSRNAEPQ
jgi:hypothetical protein